MEKDRNPHHRADAQIADRGDGGGIGGVVGDGHRRSCSKHRTDDPHMRLRVNADDTLAGPRARGHDELLASPDVHRRVLRLDERQRAARDRPQQLFWLGLGSDLSRDPLEAASQT